MTIRTVSSRLWSGIINEIKVSGIILYEQWYFCRMDEQKKTCRKLCKTNGCVSLAAVPIEEAEYFTDRRLLGEVQPSSPALEFSFQCLIWGSCSSV